MRASCDGQAAGEPPLTITVSDVAPYTILCEVLGEIDLATVSWLQEKLTEVNDLRPSHLVIDLSDIRFLGSAGLNLLTEIHDAQLAAGYHLAIVVGSNRVATRSLNITGLNQILDLHAELAPAVQACRADQRSGSNPRSAHVTPADPL